MRVFRLGLGLCQQLSPDRCYLISREALSTSSALGAPVRALSKLHCHDHQAVALASLLSWRPWHQTRFVSTVHRDQVSPRTGSPHGKHDDKRARRMCSNCSTSVRSRADRACTCCSTPATLPRDSREFIQCKTYICYSFHWPEASHIRFAL